MITPAVHHTDTRRPCAGCGTRVYTYADELDEQGRAVRHFCTICANRASGVVLCRFCHRPIVADGAGWRHRDTYAFRIRHEAIAP